MQEIKTCCFSGHRIIEQSQREDIIKRIYEAVELLIEKGVTNFYAGGAIGFDMLAADVVISLKQKYPQIKLIIAIPYPGQQQRWTPAQQYEYREILKQADERIFVSDRYAPDCYHKRNRYMVDRSHYLICYLKKMSGGTYYTVRYAQDNGLKIKNLAIK